MSKLTLSEAIKHCLEVAEKNESKAQKIGCQFLGTTKDREATECRECAADHRQLAEWLTELKDLRAEQNEQYVFIHELMSELEKVKRLLKAAVEDLERLADDEICFSYCDERCPFDCVGGCEEKHWKHLDEASKLIES